jgi:hypothetical protein
VTSHPSQLTLERSSVGDLPAADSDALAAHLDDCDPCRAMLAELEAAAVAHRAADPARFIAAVRARRQTELRRPRLLAIGAGLAVVAAAAVVILAAGGEPAPPAPPAIAFKGGAAVAVYRLRGTIAAPLGPADGVRAGDRLRLVITLRRSARVAVWFVDEDGRVDPLLAAPIELGAGAQTLPGAVEVEAPCRDSVVAVAIGEAADRVTAAAIARDRTLHESGEDLPPGVSVVALPCEQ